MSPAQKFVSCLLFLAYLLSACAPQAIASRTPSPTESQTAAPSPSPIPTGFPNVSAQIISEPEVIFDWSAGHCAEPNAPDLPVRPFRNAVGLITIILSSPNNYRLVGPDLDHLELDCDPTLVSNFDFDPSHFNYSEWLGATYTLDGNTIYAIVHNEYHGDLGSQWDSWRDFSAQQRANDWSYNFWTGADYQPMTYDAANDRWQGPRTYCQASNWGLHPDGPCEPAYTWTSPIEGSVFVRGSVNDFAPEDGDGVDAAIYFNDQLLWSQTIGANDAGIYPFELQVDVIPGDQLFFRVNQRNNSGYDSTLFRIRIDRGADPCPSLDYDRCFNASLTYAVSTDGGATFTQPQPPHYLIAAPPGVYAPDAGFFAMWQPSNIVFNPNDGFYYLLLARVYAPYEQPGHVNATCVMRTATLDDPASWRAWDGQGFNLPLANPYIGDGDSGAAACTSVEEMGLTYSLTYNSYLGTFMAAGHGFAPTVPVTGFYYKLSYDLVHWSEPHLLMPAEFVQTTDGPYLAYPSLVNPDSPSLSFDVVGQDAYLYYSIFNERSLTNTDLLRVRVHFERQ